MPEAKKQKLYESLWKENRVRTEKKRKGKGKKKKT